MTGDRPAARRVFLSHTSELRKFPSGTSFVDAAEAAVIGNGDAVTDMLYFVAQDAKVSDECREAVQRADIFVLICGSGTAVRSATKPSSRTLSSSIKPLVNSVSHAWFSSLDRTPYAPRFFSDQFADRQTAFRTLLESANRMTVTVNTPAKSASRLLKELTAERRTQGRGNPLGRLWTIPAHNPDYIGRERFIKHLHASMTSEDRPVRAITGIAGLGKSTTAIEYADRYSDDYDIAWWIPAQDPALVPPSPTNCLASLELWEWRLSPTRPISRSLGSWANCAAANDGCSSSTS